MQSRLMFPPGAWGAVLPPVLRDLEARACPGGRALLKWCYIPPQFRPPLLKEARETFWGLLKAARDPRDPEAWPGDVLGRFARYAKDDPAALCEMLSVPVDSPMDAMGHFLRESFACMEDVLRESNQRDGELDNKLVGHKVKIFTNIRQQAEAILKMHQAWKDRQERDKYAGLLENKGPALTKPEEGGPPAFYTPPPPDTPIRPETVEAEATELPEDEATELPEDEATELPEDEGDDMGLGF